MTDIQYTDVIDTSSISDPSRRADVESVFSQMQSTVEGQEFLSRIQQGTGTLSVTNLEGVGDRTAFNSETATLNGLIRPDGEQFHMLCFNSIEFFSAGRCF